MSKLDIFRGFQQELTLIMEKTANIPPPGGSFGDAMKGVGNYMKNTVPRNWKDNGNGIGGMIGKGLTVGLPAASIASDLQSTEDPSGLGRSKAERVSGTVGSTLGGMSGSTIGRDAGQALAKGLDPRDQYMSRAMGRAKTIASNVPMAGKPHPAVAGVSNKIKALGWKGRLASGALGMLPTLGSLYGGYKGMQAGEAVGSAPFKPFRQQPQYQIQAPQPAPVQ